MTLDTDVVRLHLVMGTPTIPCKALGLEWPPPQRLYMGDFIREPRDGDDESFILVRARCSELDDETASHPHIARGAEYYYVHAPEAKDVIT